MYLCILSKENLDLAQQEAQTVLGTTAKRDGEFLFLTPTKEGLQNMSHLALTKKVLNILAQGNANTIHEQITLALSEKTASYRVSFSGITEKEEQQPFFKSIFYAQKNPKITLENPEKEYYIIKREEEFYCAETIYEQDYDFSERLPHKRPGLKPISLHPRLARVCVNLLGSKTTVCDPFCGTGGMLIEAGLIGLSISGSDISSEMVAITKKTLNEFSLDTSQIIQKDFFSYESIEYAIADLPYGKNTKDLSVDFFENVLGHFDMILQKQAVLIFPDSLDYPALLAKCPNLKIVYEFSHYIHKSMTKHVAIIRRNDMEC